MSSVQERLQLKRVPLDKWSVKEQLCLASAVACSGDQNWMSVSRSLKMLCSSNRPSDWFSQKSCAAQYGKLLENVETPKRKKRTVSERDNSAVETPSELILRKLTQERIIELQKIISDEQQQYLKFKEDIAAVQIADTNKLRDMLNQIEIETKQIEKERFQHSQWLKEREERKLEMERAWLPSGINVALSGAPLAVISTNNPLRSNLPIAGAQILPQTSKAPLTLKIKTEDSIEVDESSSQTSITSTKQGTSPLLTSLLKSPSQAQICASTTTPSNVIATTISSQQFPSTAVRNSSPTITNLLTSNIITTTPSSEIKASLSTASTQSGSSTLSKLLEPTEIDSTGHMESTISIKKEIKKEDSLLPFTDLTIESPSSNDHDSNKDDDQQLMEVFNGLIPDNIDELADILTQTNAIISLSPELLEEGSILGNVDSLIDSHVEIDQGSNIKVTIVTENKNEEIMNSKSQMEKLKIEDEIKSEWNEEDKPVIYKKEEADKTNVEKIGDIMNKNNLHQETTSSSNSDIQGETTIVKTNIQRSISNDETQINKSEIHQEQDILQPPSPQSSENDIMIIEDNTPPASEHGIAIESNSHLATDPKNDESILQTSTKDQNNDLSIKIIHDDSKMIIEVIDENDKKENNNTDSEINSKIDQSDTKVEKSEQGPIEIVVKSNQSSIDKLDDNNFNNIKEDLQLIDDNKDIQDIAQSISLIDTDDDSPIEVIKEDKIGKQKRDYSRKKLDNQKIEDNSIDELNKPGLSLRLKLKERDRSESPFVLDEDNDDIPRTRRRYSSTPNIDSIPNSPASSTTTNDDRDYKLWKKSILIAFNRIQMHKHSSIFLKLDDQNTNYKKIILRPIDLITIKKNVETEIIRSTVEFQRDIMLMCSNLLFLNPKMQLTVREFLDDALNTIDSTFDCTRKDEKIGLSGGSTGGSSTSSNLNQSQSSNSSFSTTSGKGRGGRKSSRMSNV